MALVIKRTALFIAIVVIWALIVAMARAATPARDIVAFSGFAPGTIVVKTGERRLYYVIDEQRARISGASTPRSRTFVVMSIPGQMRTRTSKVSPLPGRSARPR